MSVEPKVAPTQTRFLATPVQEPVITLVQLLREELCLEAQQVVVYNQKWKIPPTGDLFLVVAFESSLPYAWSKNYVPNLAEELISVQTLNSSELYKVTLYCSNAASRIRKNEVILALSSDRAQRYQELYQFKIANLSESFLDASQVEATARLNRYDISFRVLTSYEKRTSVPFFDQFPKSTIITQP